MAPRVGRPPLLNEIDKANLVQAFEEYIENTDIPIVAQFAAMHRLGKQYFYDHKEFSTLVKWCTAKKESALEIGTLEGRLNAPMAIFSLKQCGWTDKAREKIIYVDPKTLTDRELRAILSDEGVEEMTDPELEQVAGEL